MSTIRRIRWFAVCVLIAGLTICGVSTVDVYADSVDVYFGSKEYEYDNDESFLIGVYIESETNRDDYEVVVSYDENYVTYVKGADSSSVGTVTLKGTLNGTYQKYLLTFKAKAGGETEVVIESATVGDETVEVLPTAPVHLTTNEGALLTDISIDGESIDEFNKNTLTYDITVPYTDSQLDIEAAGQSGVKATVSSSTLKVGDNTILIEATGSNSSRNIYKLNVCMEEKVAEDVVSPETDATENSDVVNQTTDQAEIKAETEEARKDRASIQITIPVINKKISVFNLLLILLIFFSTIFVVDLTLTLIGSVKSRKTKQARAKARAKAKAKAKANAKGMRTIDNLPVEDATRKILDTVDLGIEWFNLTDNEFDFNNFEIKYEEPVISVQNVTMKFRISTSDASGLKEFLIQKLKRKVTYRELLALDHVNFDVYKGEVVGIIGTNGSGKSTLLRIVSGALNPSYGKVVVDRSKVQLLTLGTGFDMELTARENIYLNGAIIGYTKKFLDDHFDEIVEFAELKDFVDEKVKNFSSGMVSRLGFAIATAGDAAEILILDEVLSVGDEFFRKKSLARIKEMIHGGSTVLMVSHGMGTILDNCTKVVWIEKGRLQMVGEAKTVCQKYQARGGM